MSIGEVGMPLVDAPDGRLERRQVSQPQKIHLQQPGLLDVTHLPLGRHHLLGLVLVGQLLKRDQFLQRPVRDHHSRRVRTDVPVHPFDPPGKIKQLRDLGVFVRHPLQRRLLVDRFRDRDVQPPRHQLVDLLDSPQRNVERPSDVLDRRLRLERAERADLRDVGVAVLLPNVIDHLVAPVLAQVDVDVRRFGAARVEEPLEQQVVLDRADVADLKQIAHERAARRAAGRSRNAPLAAHNARSPTRSGSTMQNPSR